MSRFRLPPSPEINFGNCVVECFYRYLSHSMQALQFTDPISIQFRVTATHGPGVLEVAATEGRRVAAP